MVDSAQAYGNPGGGGHYIEPEGSFDGYDIIYMGPTGALGVAMYNAIIEVGEQP